MRKSYLMLFAVAAILALCASSWATPIAGSNNELLNANFENSPIIAYQRGFPIYGGGPWTLGQWVAVEMDGDHGIASNCKNDAYPEGLWMYQIVDESLNPLWLPNGTAKIVDLMADIRVVGDHANSNAIFQLGWWSTNYDTQPAVDIVDGVPVFPTTGFQWTDPVVCGVDSPGTWYTVNPFNRVLLPEQPRWLVVMVRFDQMPGETLWVDDLKLTSKCLPEPMSVALGVLGLFSVTGLRRLRIR